jgi:signal transduction protein with GAF and PtsI domain
MATAADRLHLLYDVNRLLTTFGDIDQLLRYATRRARELLGAEGCALLLLDRERNEFYFPIASQDASYQASTARLEVIRFPAERGIAGWVLVHNEPALVADAAQDPRFYSGVDQLTNMTTRSVLCAPLRSRSGNIGVVEVINPTRGHFTTDDLEFLAALADDIAVAYEKALLHERLRSEVIGLRQVCGFAGFGLVGLGLVVGLGATVAHLAHALPLRELPSRPRMWVGGLLLLIGGLLLGVARGWLISRTPETRVRLDVPHQ